MTTGKINFFETTLGKVIMWTMEIITVIALLCPLLYMTVFTPINFTPEQMELFHRIMDNKNMNVVVLPWISMMCAGFVLAGYLLLNMYRWLHRLDIKELKLKIKQLEAGEETV